jgi:secondary thiamine-phosphate synthase enzyme
MYKEYVINTRLREELVLVTGLVREAVAESGVKEGVCLVQVPHTTAGIMINENADPDVGKDILKGLKQMVPDRADYLHQEGNSSAHIKASLMGCSVQVMIEAGCLMLGTWQGIYFCEFDGPRSRKLWVRVQ